MGKDSEEFKCGERFPEVSSAGGGGPGPNFCLASLIPLINYVARQGNINVTNEFANHLIREFV